MRRPLPRTKAAIGMCQPQQGRHRTAQRLYEEIGRHLALRNIALLQQAQQADELHQLDGRARHNAAIGENCDAQGFGQSVFTHCAADFAFGQ